jgi:hypothetical protein
MDSRQIAKNEFEKICNQKNLNPNGSFYIYKSTQNWFCLYVTVLVRFKDSFFKIATATSLEDCNTSFSIIKDSNNFEFNYVNKLLHNTLNKTSEFRYDCLSLYLFNTNYYSLFDDKVSDFIILPYNGLPVFEE